MRRTRPDGAHGVVDAAAAEAGLGHHERAAARAEHVVGRHPHVLVADVALAPAAERLVAETDVAQDVDARRLRRHDEHRVPFVGRRVGVGDRHHDEERRHRANDENHFSPLMTHSSPSCTAAVVKTFGSAPPCGLGHREARHDAVVEQRLQVPRLQLGRAVVGEDLAVAGVGRLRAEHDRRHSDRPRISLSSASFTWP